MRCAAPGPWVDALAAGSAVGAALADILVAYRAAFRERFGRDAVALHDAVALLEAIVPGTLRTTPLPVRVACDHGPARGATVPDGRPDAPGPKIHVALDADVDAVLEEIACRLRD
jgi:pyrimidine-specific ribonucleoside hydrolase